MNNFQFSRQVSIRIGQALPGADSVFNLTDDQIKTFARKEVLAAIMCAYRATGSNETQSGNQRDPHGLDEVTDSPADFLNGSYQSEMQLASGLTKRQNSPEEAVLSFYGPLSRQGCLVTKGMYKNVVNPAITYWRRIRDSVDAVCNDPELAAYRLSIDSDILLLKNQENAMDDDLLKLKSKRASAQKTTAIKSLLDKPDDFHAEFNSRHDTNLSLPSGKIVCSVLEKKEYVDAYDKAKADEEQMNEAERNYKLAKNKYKQVAKGSLSLPWYVFILLILGMGEWFTNIKFFRVALSSGGYNLPLFAVVVMALVVLVIVIAIADQSGKRLAWLARCANNVTIHRNIRFLASFLIVAFFLTSLAVVFYLIYYSRTSAYVISSIAYRTFISAAIPNVLLLFGGSLVSFFREKQNNLAIQSCGNDLAKADDSYTLVKDQYNKSKNRLNSTRKKLMDILRHENDNLNKDNIVILEDIGSLGLKVVYNVM